MASLGIAGVLMVGKVPIFMTNLYHGGPYLGVAGAKAGFYIVRFVNEFKDHLKSNNS